ncbi:aminodeoxychorismate lyase [Kangiella japonica]|uniref:Aminodeoxychorismate lyase n=1 Tax=Kangiella japonica TaxID=647384 RepID=A0ABN0T4J8_9GAMM
MATIYINGQESSSVSASDRGLLYGDGFFTTMKVRHNQVEHWPLHIERISFSATRLKFPAIDIQLLEHDIAHFIDSQAESNGVIRLTITRGTGSRGYRAPKNPVIKRILSWSDFAPSFDDVKSGVELIVCETPYSVNSALAGVKHLNRLEQVLAQEEVAESCFDGIMLAKDLIVGGTKTNIYFYREGVWLTPKLHDAGVDGTLRRWLLATHSDFNQANLGLDILSDAKHCMVSNALHGLVPVTKIGHHRYAKYPKLKELRNSYEHSSLT